MILFDYQFNETGTRDPGINFQLNLAWAFLGMIVVRCNHCVMIIFFYF